MNITHIAEAAMARKRAINGEIAGIEISDDDLAAYVAGSLGAARRATVEGFLACNPDLAAQVMREWHQGARIREVSSERRPQTGLRLRLVVAGLFCMAAGWALAEGLDDDGPFRDLSPTPEYVDDALMSQQVTHVRIGMDSQPESVVLDSAEIERATRIRLPPLPASWRLMDAQVYPSDDGPSLNVLLEVEPGRNLSLFAVMSGSAAGSRPVIARQKGVHVAYWESGGAAFVLSGEGSSRGLLADALQLSHLAPL